MFPRVIDDVGLALESRQRGMRAVLVKAHEHDTTGRAELVRRQVPGIEAFGGIVLNASVGGLNPDAVDQCIKLGGRMVWMPTLSSRHHIGFFGGSHFGKAMKPTGPARETKPQGLSILDGGGRVRSEVREILGLIAAADICLSTGHLSLPEIDALVSEARSAGVRKILVTHPDLNLSAIPIADQKRLAAEGVYLEKDIITMMPAWQSVTLEQMAAGIRAVGPAHCVLATDFGQLHHPVPPEGMRMFVQLLLEQGFSPDELRTMVATNPARLLGLGPTA
jgi:hypothetical protein